MSTVKTKFTLHKNYKDFTAGVSKIDPKTLVPYIETEHIGNRLGCMVLTPIAVTVFLIFTIVVLIDTAVFPLLIQFFGKDTTAQVTQCTMKSQKGGSAIPYLTYTYIWNGQTLTDIKPMDDYGIDGCSTYLHQSVPIRILESNPSETVFLSTRTGLISYRTNSILIFFLFAIASFAVVYASLRRIALKIRAKIIYPRLAQKGIVLEGKLDRIKSVTSKNSFIIRVNYSFETPHKRRLTGWAEARRDDLKGTELPPVGAPVAILYADDHAHMML